MLEPIDYDYLHLWGHYARLVELREKLLGRLRDSAPRASNLGSLGLAYHSLGQFERAIRLYKEAPAIARESGDRRNESVWLNDLGTAHRILGSSVPLSSPKRPWSSLARLAIAKEKGPVYSVWALPTVTWGSSSGLSSSTTSPCLLPMRQVTTGVRVAWSVGWVMPTAPWDISSRRSSSMKRL